MVCSRRWRASRGGTAAGVAAIAAFAAGRRGRRLVGGPHGVVPRRSRLRAHGAKRPGRHTASSPQSIGPVPCCQRGVRAPPAPLLRPRPWRQGGAPSPGVPHDARRLLQPPRAAHHPGVTPSSCPALCCWTRSVVRAIARFDLPAGRILFWSGSAAPRCSHGPTGTVRCAGKRRLDTLDGEHSARPRPPRSRRTTAQAGAAPPRPAATAGSRPSARNP